MVTSTEEITLSTPKMPEVYKYSLTPKRPQFKFFSSMKSIYSGDSEKSLGKWPHIG